jgi:hypothetical protein
MKWIRELRWRLFHSGRAFDEMGRLWQDTRTRQYWLVEAVVRTYGRAELRELQRYAADLRKLSEGMDEHGK